MFCFVSCVCQLVCLELTSHPPIYTSARILSLVPWIITDNLRGGGDTAWHNLFECILQILISEISIIFDKPKILQINVYQSPK